MRLNWHKKDGSYPNDKYSPWKSWWFYHLKEKRTIYLCLPFVGGFNLRY
jgi:hypothetical protein